VVSRSERLHTGDQVQVLTTENTMPTEEWLNECQTQHARDAIKLCLRTRRKEFTAEGKHRLAEYLKKQRIRNNPQNFGQLKRFFNQKSDVDLYYDIAVGNISERQVAECFGKARPEPQLFFLDHYKEIHPFLLDREYEDYPTETASCCKPVPGDQVVGIVQDGKIMVHRTNCREAMKEMANHENHTVRAKWRQGEQLSLLTGISLTAIDRKGLLQEITGHISDEMDLNMRAITLEASEGVARGIIMLYVNDVVSLNGLIAKLKSIDGVEDVHRI